MMKREANYNMLTTEEIIETLKPASNSFFTINNLDEYANKLSKAGKCISLRSPDTATLLSYILYYDNLPEIFISMVWTNPDHRGKGYAGQLLKKMIADSSKDIILEVNRKNPAKWLYQKLKFKNESEQEERVWMAYRRRLSIMQPYIFPYIGYFHLIEASEKIVFYDDVNYIKGGWVNRNRILLNGKAHFFTVPLENASSFRLISDTSPLASSDYKEKFLGQVRSAYLKAPYYKDVLEIINPLINKTHNSIADLAIDSVVSIYNYLGREINYTRSSVCSPGTKDMDKADRLIAITKEMGYHKYINPPGGKDLYDKNDFQQHDIELSFIQSNNTAYKQFSNEYIPWLSIIDVLMFNDKRSVEEKFADFNIE